MKQSVWISYDLGIKGDYPGLYKWLDINKAKESGNNLAFMKFDYATDFVAEFTQSIKDTVDFKNGDRIYIITKLDDSFSGKFIIGNRKSSPWEGYAPVEGNNIDE
jgi:hypothetical protein